MVLRSEPAPSANPDSSTDGTDQERTDPLKRLYSTHSTTTAGDDNDQSNDLTPRSSTDDTATLFGERANNSYEEEADPYERSYSTYSTTTADDDEANELTPTASGDEAAILSINGRPPYTYIHCEPPNITKPINSRDGHLFAVHFEGCHLGKFNIDNCILLNGTFKNCTFDRTTFSNTFMKDVVMGDCYFSDYIWQNGRREDDKISGLMRVEVTDWKVEVPEELKDPNWLADELDGTHELIRAIAAGSIADIPPEASHQKVDIDSFKTLEGNNKQEGTYAWDAANEYIRAVTAGKIVDVDFKARSQKSAQRASQKSARKERKERELEAQRMRAWERLSKKLSKDREWLELGNKARELEDRENAR